MILSITEGKRSLGRPTPTWEYNIKIYLTKIFVDGVGWIDILQYWNK
jgi:hypothetical protein